MQFFPWQLHFCGSIIVLLLLLYNDHTGSKHTFQGRLCSYCVKFFHKGRHLHTFFHTPFTLPREVKQVTDTASLQMATHHWELMREKGQRLPTQLSLSLVISQCICTQISVIYIAVSALYFYPHSLRQSHQLVWHLCDEDRKYVLCRHKSILLTLHWIAPIPFQHLPKQYKKK